MPKLKAAVVCQSCLSHWEPVTLLTRDRVVLPLSINRNRNLVFHISVPFEVRLRHAQSGRSALSANPSALLSESPGTRTTISAPRSIFWGCLLLRRCRTNFHISSNFSSLEGGLIHVVSRACSSTNFANFMASYNRATSSTSTSHLLPRRDLRSPAAAILSLMVTEDRSWC